MDVDTQTYANSGDLDASTHILNHETNGHYSKEMGITTLDKRSKRANHNIKFKASSLLHVIFAKKLKRNDIAKKAPHNNLLICL